MLSNKILSAICTTTNAIQHYKALNILTNDCFKTTFENQQKLSIEKKIKNNSPLYDRPILKKDYFCLCNTLIICASKMFANFHASYTSTIL
ncbi:unnamed protein product [Rotaria sordida]|uniref:Uncharacterized protein n=1 Tax=Rotaria sordida TaxID=392033 RepID=A0A818V8X3_9BILA|nr:unnamed protein product [Rotaria sordida]CAF1172071.1 unnamed protein product [Rotaria sordida]CAF1173569.1 unnamed protein product [Rotaria sordida]CAF1429887.1 unnamed protein product [Rotaria sordida]CAF3707729.1 unnamed protein product [Rotaria sordida]